MMSTINTHKRKRSDVSYMNLYSSYEQQESHCHPFSSTGVPTDNTIHHIIHEEMEEPIPKRLCTHSYLPQLEEHRSQELHQQQQQQQQQEQEHQQETEAIKRQEKQLSPFSSRFITIQDNLDFLEKLTRDLAEHNRRREQAKRRLQFTNNI